MTRNSSRSSIFDALEKMPCRNNPCACLGFLDCACGRDTNELITSYPEHDWIHCTCGHGFEEAHVPIE